MATITELNQELLRLSMQLGKANADFTAACHEFAEAEHEYRKAQALAYQSAEGTVDARKARVDQVCDKERLAAYLARARKESTLELIRSIRTQLDCLRSVAAGTRAELEQLGSPEPDYNTVRDGAPF